MLEKWRSWSDCRGDVIGRFGRDFLLAMLTIYWVTETATSSARLNYDHRRYQAPAGTARPRRRAHRRRAPERVAEPVVDVDRSRDAQRPMPGTPPELIWRSSQAFAAISQSVSESCASPWRSIRIR